MSIGAGLAHRLTWHPWWAVQTVGRLQQALGGPDGTGSTQPPGSMTVALKLPREVLNRGTLRVRPALIASLG